MRASDSNTHGNVLAINGGSSSIKFAVFRTGEERPQSVLRGEIDRIGQKEGTLQVIASNDRDSRTQSITAPDHASANLLLMQWIEENGGDTLAAVGHRLVHGGPKYSAPEQVNDRLIQDLQQLSPFDSEHLPAELRLIEAVQGRFPDVLQVACFDTAFHWNMPRVARLLPLPRRYEAKGIRRYGFHGLSYAYLMEELARVAGAKVANGKVILAHLGSGASLAAVSEGTSMDTSMSFTPNSGVPMSTRSGDLDPGLVWYLARTEEMSTRQFNEMVSFHSGLLGISETSADMRDLLECEARDIRAAEAVSLFCYQIKKTIGAFAAALGGLDTLVFAGGIGENAPAIRSRVCNGLGFLGIEMEETRNMENEGVVSTANSKTAVRVIHTDEELMIAQTVCRFLSTRTGELNHDTRHAFPGTDPPTQRILAGS